MLQEACRPALAWEGTGQEVELCFGCSLLVLPMVASTSFCASPLSPRTVPSFTYLVHQCKLVPLLHDSNQVRSGSAFSTPKHCSRHSLSFWSGLTLSRMLSQFLEENKISSQALVLFVGRLLPMLPLWEAAEGVFPTASGQPATKTTSQLLRQPMLPRSLSLPTSGTLPILGTGVLDRSHLVNLEQSHGTLGSVSVYSPLTWAVPFGGWGGFQPKSQVCLLLLSPSTSGKRGEGSSRRGRWVPLGPGNWQEVVVCRTKRGTLGPLLGRSCPEL